MRTTLLALAALLPACFASSNTAYAQSATAPAATCQWITTLPADLKAPGTYCLKQNLSTSVAGGAINIYASNVTLDCKGRSITQTDATNGSTGISGGGFGPVADVTVKSCKLVDFATGIIFGIQSDRIEISNNDIVRPQLDGIVLWGSHSRIVGNSVLNGHNPFYDYNHAIMVTAFEPGVKSTGNTITNNIVAGAHGNGTIWGIRADMSDDLLINNNQVINLQPNEGGFASSIQSDGANVRVLNNVIVARGGNVFGNTGNAALCSRNVTAGLANDGFQWCTQSVNNTSMP